MTQPSSARSPGRPFTLLVAAGAAWLAWGSGGTEGRSAVAAGVATPAATVAQPSRPVPGLRFDLDPGRVERVSPSTYAPHFLKGSYTENWSYLFSFPSGYTVISRLTITNRGPGDGRGGGIALVIDPAGRVIRQVNSRARDRWSRTVTDDGVEMEVATQGWDIRPPVHELRMQSSRGRFDIAATALTDVYRPGRLRYGRDDFYDLTMLAPRLTARGTVQFPGEEPVELRDGAGFAYHAYSNLDEQDQAISWLQFHTFDADLQVSLWELTAPEKHGHQRVAVSLLFDHGRLVSADTGHGREYGDLRPDPESPHYPVPGSFTFAQEDGAARSVRGEVTLRPRLRLELVDLINSGVTRFFVRRMMEPVVYEFAAEYALRAALEGRTFETQGTGVASLQIVDDPPDRF